jgi:hypothetical protein
VNVADLGRWISEWDGTSWLQHEIVAIPDPGHTQSPGEVHTVREGPDGFWMGGGGGLGTSGDLLRRAYRP